MALATKAVVRRSDRPLVWLPPRALPQGFLSLSSEPHQCFAAAVRAAERFPTLKVMFGHSYRAEEPHRGIGHFWCVDGDDEVVDPALKLYGTDGLSGYLGVLPTLPQLRDFAARNGLEIPLLLRQ
jgi:hypothetical protein